MLNSKSSSAEDDYIWLGTEPETITVFRDESFGKYDIIPMPKLYQINTRMHLSRQQVADLLPLLHKFAETEEI